jgi:hypothetical protein
VRHDGGKEGAYRVLVRKLQERDQLEDLDLDWRIIEGIIKK